MSKIIHSSAGLLAAGRIQMQSLTNSSLLRLSTQRYYNCLSSQAGSITNTTPLMSSNPNPSTVQSITVRSLFSESTVGLDKLDYLRSRSDSRIANSERFVERILGYLESGDHSSIFMDDLVNLILVATEEKHVDLIEKIAKIRQGESGSFSTSAWGSMVMRLYYKMNLVDRAYNSIKDESYGPFFCQRSTFRIAMTLLYNAGRYQDVIELFDLSTKRLKANENQIYKTDRRLTVLVFAACAKLNTPEALETARNLYLQDPNNPNLKRRVVGLMCYLALKQNKPILALDLISDAGSIKGYVTMREFKTLCLVHLKRYEDVVQHIRSTMNFAKSDQKIMLKQTVDLLEQSKGDIEDENVRQELEDVIFELRSNQMIDDAVDIDSLVFKELEITDPPKREGRSNQEGRQNQDRRAPKSYIEMN